MSEYFLPIAMLIFGFAAGAVVGYPSENRDTKIKAEGTVAVYEGRATCEKALDQWVCSVPKN